MRTLLAPLAIVVLFFVTQCGGLAVEPRADGGVGGSPAAGSAGVGTAGAGGTTGGGGKGGYTCAQGGEPAYCDGNVYVPGDPMCVGPGAPTPAPAVTCQGDTPLCGPGCAACPGSGGAPMVSIGTVCVDSTDVTRANYEAWLVTGPSTANQPPACEGNTSFSPDPACMGQPDVCASNCDSHPQTCVDWCDARAYCASVGKRLCAKFSAQTDWPPQNPDELGQACQDNTSQQYPYGQNPLPTACNGSDLGVGTTVPAGSLTTCARTYNNGKIYDLVGNVWEWQGFCDALGCTATGGSYKETSAANTCSALSIHPRDYVASNLGFRCCAP